MTGRRRRSGAGLVVIALIPSLTGCGGAGPRAHRVLPPAAPAPPRAIRVARRGRGYTWLGPINGRASSVAVENRRRGTSAWRLPGAAAEVGGLAFGRVTGYAARPAVLAGQTEHIDVTGVARVRIRIFRMGWYHGLGGREVLRSGWLRVASQPPCHHSDATGLTECHWRPTLSFTVPTALPSGVYIVRMDAPGAARDCLFVIRSAAPAPLLVQVPDATYEAYNGWGGDSLYPGGVFRVQRTGTTQGSAVSYSRPYDSITGAGQFFSRDVAMIRFLERYGYPVAYTDSPSVDADPGQLFGRRALIDIGHSEYWSGRQLRGFAAALHTGTSLLFFSSDLAAQPVRFARGAGGPGRAGQPGETIVALGGLAGGPGGLTRGDHFRVASAALTGSAYEGCITERVPSLGSPAYRYYAWSPSPGLQPRWLFAHTGITAGSSIPGIVGYELDGRVAGSPAATRVIGGGSAPCLSTGEGPGDTRLTPGGQYAQTTLYRARSGALVFNTGTLGWELGLEPVPSASPDAPRAPEAPLVALTRNLLRHVLTPR